jgi:putative alpha-1,2-mannosidase
MYAYTAGTSDGAWRVQHRVRSILADLYRSDPGGLPGNEDAGQMSSWYVLAGLGLYPVCPGCGGYSEYVVSSPLFDRSRLAVGDEKYFTISAKKTVAEVNNTLFIICGCNFHPCFNTICMCCTVCICRMFTFNEPF